MRELHHKGSALILMGRYGKFAFVKVDDFLCQNHTYTISGSYILIVSPVKQFKQVFFVCIGHSYAIIRQADNSPLFPISYQDG